ncbi:MAG: lipopolysaccharide heptosyltransferase I [Halioglobus sp.]|nr:lipopolysaccharide heptosyltransferase I [Halioglobus sp.]
MVKLSSLGDVIHTLPALEDAAAALPGISFDWVVEEAFAEIPAWHRAVDRVIPVALRRWRKHPVRDFTGAEWRAARAALRQRRYDAVIDAQGLLKSALIARLVAAPRYGMDRASARERLAALAYDHLIGVPRDMHAVERIRTLFASALNYPLPRGLGSYGLGGDVAPVTHLPRGLLFFHGTARSEKLWPEARWVALAALAEAAGYRVWLPWGNEEEHQRARRIARDCDNAEVLPSLTLRELAGLLLGAAGAVAVDTGLGHLAAALSVPTVSLYGPTSTRLIGTYGLNQVHLQSPLAGGDITDPLTLMQAITPPAAWQSLRAALAGAA